jgi:DNA polymerase (family 10)
MSNADVVHMLRELALLATLDEGSPQSFRVRAYENAAIAIQDHPAHVADLSLRELTAIKGIGQSTAKKIHEFSASGTFPKLEALRKKYPPEFVELTHIPGLGPKTLLVLRDRLGVNDLEGLQQAIEREELRGLSGLGARSEEKIKAAIGRLGLHGKDRRTPIATGFPIAQAIVEELGKLKGVEDARYCGSLRRFSETIGDVDILVAAKDPAPIMDHFVALSIADQVLVHGTTKSSIVTRDKLQIDLLVIDPKEFGAALVYFTGSKAHNIALRQRALARGWTLNEHSLSDIETERVVAAKTEAAIYRKLGLSFIPPELREDTGEIEAAASRSLPQLVEIKDIRGDLHVHTSLSGDGRESLEKMVAAAAERGLSYLAITDHGEDLAINGATREQMLRQRRRLRKLQERYPHMDLLHGVELNIGTDGGLDYDDDFLMGFDWCIASIHSSFDLDPARQTDRLLTAINHPAVNAVGHLSGRMIGRRPGIEFDIEPVLEAAIATGTAIEINGALDRLDATAQVARLGADSGAVFVIDTDAHHSREYRRVDWGVQHARRGWLEPSHVANTWPQKRFRLWARKNRKNA